MLEETRRVTSTPVSPALWRRVWPLGTHAIQGPNRQGIGPNPGAIGKPPVMPQESANGLTMRRPGGAASLAAPLCKPEVTGSDPGILHTKRPWTHRAVPWSTLPLTQRPPPLDFSSSFRSLADRVGPNRPVTLLQAGRKGGRIGEGTGRDGSGQPTPADVLLLLPQRRTRERAAGSIPRRRRRLGHHPPIRTAGACCAGGALKAD
jgi:hypothetical protein